MLELVVHALSHISFAILLCEHAGCIFYSFEDIHLLFWLFGFIFFCQVDGQECLRTSSSYLCFSCLKLYSCCITKFYQVRFEPLCVRSARSPRFVIDLNFQNLFMILSLTDTPLSVLPRYFQNFFVHFGLTDSFISVIPRALSRSRFSISVQPIWTFRSHRVSVTAHSYESRCHRVVPLGHTDRVGLYIVTGRILEISPKPLRPQISPKPLRPRNSLLCPRGLRIVFSPPAASSRWSPSPSMGILPRRCRRSKSTPN